MRNSLYEWAMNGSQIELDLELTLLTANHEHNQAYKHHNHFYVDNEQPSLPALNARTFVLGSITTAAHLAVSRQTDKTAQCQLNKPLHIDPLILVVKSMVITSRISEFMILPWKFNAVHDEFLGC